MNERGKVKFGLVEGVIEAAFSPEERKFIEEKIISKFELEKEIVDRVKIVIKKKKKIEGKDLASSIIQVITGNPTQSDPLKGKTKAEKEALQEREKMHRMATMGRLAEIGVVDWEIENGKSYYSINTK